MKTDPISFTILSFVILAGVILAFVDPTPKSSPAHNSVNPTPAAQTVK